MPTDDNPYGFTEFTRACNLMSTAPPGLLASDSRLRPDRVALEEGANAEVRSIHWSPYDRVGVVNADP
jgi:hypothetical protein